MDLRDRGNGRLKPGGTQDITTGTTRAASGRWQEADTEVVRVREARGKLIEETTHRLTDLFTIIPGKIEILSDKVPSVCREELLAIRGEVKRGVELNQRFLLAVEACRRGIGL